MLSLEAIFKNLVNVGPVSGPSELLARTLQQQSQLVKLHGDEIMKD